MVELSMTPTPVISKSKMLGDFLKVFNYTYFNKMYTHLLFTLHYCITRFLTQFSSVSLPEQIPRMQ